MKSIITEYTHAGKTLTPLRGKIPVSKNWTKTVFTVEELCEHVGNIGWVLKAEDLVVDVDPRNGGTESFEKLCKKLKTENSYFTLSPTVITPSGGYHCYLSIPRAQNFKLKKNLPDYPGIDFLSEGSQCVIVGCVTDKGAYRWYDEFLGSFEQPTAPRCLVDLLRTTDVAQDNGLGDFAGLLTTSNFPEEKVREILNKLDPAMGHNDWVKIGMALHEWDSTRGLILWDDWSKGSDKYRIGETEKRWRSFSFGGGVSVGTLVHFEKSSDYDAAQKIFNEIIGKIKVADQKTLEIEVLPKTRKLIFDDVQREKLAKTVQERYKELNGLRLPISTARELISRQTTADTVNTDYAPDWCKGWVYVNSHNAFVNLKSLRAHKTESFNLECGKFVLAINGTKPSASKFVSDNGYIKKVDAMWYLPTYDGQICQIEGQSILNSFCESSVPRAADKISHEGKNAIDIIQKHIKFICGTDTNAKFFTMWLAHQIQYPGRKILWSPIIQSIQGVGKSFFGELLRFCLGDRNVGTVSPSQVTSDFNGWATGVAVNILEELRVKGHNRHEAVNALKPLITDRMIQINEKSVKPYVVYNTTNYLCFTNYRDCIPLEEDDRRWWVIFVPVRKLDEMAEIVGEPISQYFPKLFGALRDHFAEVKRWLLDLEISDEFLNQNQAPMTEHKSMMISTEESLIDGYFEAQELLKKGGKYFNEEVISSSDFFNALLFAYPSLSIEKKQRAVLLKKLGYMCLPNPQMIDGQTRRIWTKGKHTLKELKTILLDQKEKYEDVVDLDI